MSASSKKQLRKEQNAAQLTERQLNEKKEARKLKIYTISFVLVIVLVIGIAAGILIRNGISRSGIIERSTTAAVIGEHKLNSAELNYFFVDYVNETYNNWYNTYGDYTDMYISMLYGLNPASPLDQQYYDTEGKVTWGEYFANLAAADASATYALYDHAVANNFSLTEEEKNTIDSNLSTYEFYAMAYGYSSLEDYLRAIYGNGSTMESFREYMEVTATAQAYYDAHAESLSYDDAALRAHETDRYNEYSSYTYSTFYVDPARFLTGGTKDEEGNTTYTDEEQAAALTAAKEAADQLVASAATDGLLMDKEIKKLEVYAENSSAVTTKNEDLLYASLNSIFVEWLSDADRKVGDKGVLPYETTTTAEDGTTSTKVNGYYVVIFEGRNDNTMNLVNVRHILASFEGGTTDSTTGVTTYSDAEKQAALDKINAVLDTYNAGERTEDAFAALVKENSDDTGSVDNGGLYEDVYPGQMVTAFNDWCFDEERQIGDVDVVETEYGYHLMYYAGTGEKTYRDLMIESDLLSADMDTWYNGIVDSVKAENLNIKHLNLDYIISASSGY